MTSELRALSGKVAVIKVGGATETEIDEKKFRVDGRQWQPLRQRSLKVLFAGGGCNTC
jgi:chaperonin GroEL (HSP60 family)